MLDESRWPRDVNQASGRNLRPFVPEDRSRRLRRIYLYPPPFHTVAEAVARGDRFYERFGALHELVPKAAIAVADFGIGSDAPILLDYRAGPSDPRVIHLEWPGGDHPSHWVVMAPDFASFVEMLGL